MSARSWPAAPPDEAFAARQVRTALRTARRHYREGLAGRLQQVWTWLVGAAVVVPAVVSGVLGLASAVSCAAPAPCLEDPARPALAVGLGLLGLALVVRAVRFAGPLGVGPGPAAWLLRAPVSRRVLLAPALARALLVGAAAVAVVGACAGVVLLGRPSLPALGWAAVGAAAGVALVAAGALGQSLPAEPRWWRSASRSAGLLGALVVAAAVLLPASVPDLDTAAPGPSGLGLATSTLLGAVVAGVAAGSLGRTRLSRLSLAEARRDGLRTAVAGLDRGGLVLADPTGRPAARRPGPWPHGGVWTALVLAGTVVVLARPERLLDAAVLLAVPLAVAAVAGTPAGLSVAALVAGGLLTQGTGPVRTSARSSALGRQLPLDGRAVRAALLVGPSALLLPWSLAVAWSVGASLWAGPVLVLAAVAGVLRAAPEPARDLGPVVVTEAGPLPLGLVAGTTRGPDLTLLAVAPLLLGAPPWAALLVPVLVVARLLRSGPS